MPKKPPIQPGEELLLAIRGGFIAQGTTFTEWCRQHGVKPPNARMAILGGWRGEKAAKLIRAMTAAAGVKEAA